MSVLVPGDEEPGEVSSAGAAAKGVKLNKDAKESMDNLPLPFFDMTVEGGDESAAEMLESSMIFEGKLFVDR